MLSSLRHSLRTLLRSPAFFALTVLTLAAGIASTTSIFSLFHQVLLRTLPVATPGELVVLHSDPPDLPGGSSRDHSESVFSYPMYLRLRDGVPAMRGLAARSGGRVFVSRNTGVERMQVDVVSGNFFEVMGVKAKLGRLLEPADDTVRGGNRVAVLSHDAWVAKFGSDASVVGRKLLINSEPFEVIGISGDGFRGILAGARPDLFLPISMKAAVTQGWNGFDRAGTRWLALIGRLGGSREAAQAGLQARFSAALQDHIKELNITNERARQRLTAKTIEARPAGQGINEFERQWRKPLVMLMAMVALLLAIASANLANLFLARALGRARELSIRMALGAERLRAASLLVGESAIVAIVGSALGVALAPLLTQVLLRAIPATGFDGWIGADLSIPVLAFSCAAMFAVTILFGVIPAWEATRNLSGGLGERSGGTRIRAGLRKGLVCAQVALSLVLLAGAGLFAKSLVNLLQASPGFDPRQLMAITVDPTPAGYSPERGAQFYRELLAKLAALPSVESVSMAESSPFAASVSMSNVAVEGYRTKPDEGTDCETNAVGPAYFRTMGTAVRAGREFGDGDRTGAPKVAVVNETFVRRFGLGGAAVGKRMSIGQGGPLDIEIVGVVADSKNLSMRETPQPTFYVPHAQASTRTRSAAVFARVRGVTGGFADAARGALKELEPAALFVSSRTMEARVRETMTADRLIAALAAAFGVFALLLTALGLYGVIAYLAGRRTMEFGVRMAFGAVRSSIVKLVMGEVALLAGAGAVIGTAGAVAMGRVVESQLFGLRWFDPVILGGVVALLGSVVAAAGLIPALRAAAVEPVEALRRE